MAFLDSLPVGVLALFVFGLRLTDVTLGTMRTIAVVRGRARVAVALGFVEILIWVAVVAQVITKVGEYPQLMVFYAGGFAAGNAVGIALERRLAMGNCLVTMISKAPDVDIAGALRQMGQRVTTLRGEGRDGPRQVAYVSARRRDLTRLLETARRLDPEVFYVVQFTSEGSHLAGLQVPRLGRERVKSK